MTASDRRILLYLMAGVLVIALIVHITRIVMATINSTFNWDSMIAGIGGVAALLFFIRLAIQDNRDNP